VDPKECHFCGLRECEGVDELLVQFITKKQPEVLEVYKCRILVLELNVLSKMD
jgi:hypothetical protein